MKQQSVKLGNINKQEYHEKKSFFGSLPLRLIAS